MNDLKKFQPYQAFVSQETLWTWNLVSVWNSPKSPSEGAKVIDEIRQPIEVTVVEEQQETYGLKRKLAKIAYAGKEGWVPSEALTDL